MGLDDVRELLLLEDPCPREVDILETDVDGGAGATTGGIWTLAPVATVHELAIISSIVRDSTDLRLVRLSPFPLQSQVRRSEDWAVGWHSPHFLCRESELDTQEITAPCRESRQRDGRG